MADEQTQETPVQVALKGLRENVQGFVSDLQARRASTMATRSLSTRNVLAKRQGFLSAKGNGTTTTTAPGAMIKEWLAKIPRPLGILKPATTEEKKDDETTTTTTTTTTVSTPATPEAAQQATRIRGH